MAGRAQPSAHCSSVKFPNEGLRTDTLARVAANVPRSLDRRAVLARARRRAATAGLELGCGIETLPVVGQALEAGDGAGGHVVGAEGDVARLVVALPAVAVAGFARLARGGGRRARRSVGVAAL